MNTFDRIREARRMAPNSPSIACAMLREIECETPAETEAWQRAWRWVQECSNPFIYSGK